VPGNTIIVLVVEHGQAGLVVELLETLDGDADVVLSVDGSLLDTFVVVRLRLPLLSSPAPECLAWSWLVGGWNTMIVGSSPEPAVHVDRSQVRGVAALVLKVAFPAAGVDRGDVVSSHDLLEHLELSLGIK